MKKLNNIYLLIPLVCFLFYLGLIKPGHKHLDLGTHLNYFRYLADAFLHGRLNIVNSPEIHDLVLYDGKYFLYWPPAPALVYLPLVAVIGIDLPDAFINMLFGIANVWLIMRICHHLGQRFSLELTNKHIAWIGIFWGLGTVQFYMSMQGSVWFVSQIMSQTFLFATVYLMLIEKGKTGWLILSGLFFAMTVYTRNHLIFSAVFLLFFYLALNRNINQKTIFKRGLIFIIPFLIFSFLNGWYNYTRFGNFFENGIKYHNMASYFLENFTDHGYFSFYYFPHNFFIEVLHFPTFMLHPLFIMEEPEGFGFIWGSPFFLLLIPSFLKWMGNKFDTGVSDNAIRLIKTGSLISAILIAVLIFSIMGTGWKQFCARYTLDFQFFLVIFLLFSWKDLQTISKIKTIAVCLILLSVMVQYVGSFTNF